MAAIIKADRPFRREVVSRSEAHRRFAAIGETYKHELLEAIPRTSRSPSTTRASGSISAAARTVPPPAGSAPSS
jgi:threonyl-tRNA synthetase